MTTKLFSRRILTRVSKIGALAVAAGSDEHALHPVADRKIFEPTGRRKSTPEIGGNGLFSGKKDLARLVDTTPKHYAAPEDAPQKTQTRPKIAEAEAQEPKVEAPVEVPEKRPLQTAPKRRGYFWLGVAAVAFAVVAAFSLMAPRKEKRTK